MVPGTIASTALSTASAACSQRRHAAGNRSMFEACARRESLDATRAISPTCRDSTKSRLGMCSWEYRFVGLVTTHHRPSVACRSQTLCSRPNTVSDLTNSRCSTNAGPLGSFDDCCSKYLAISVSSRGELLTSDARRNSGFGRVGITQSSDLLGRVFLAAIEPHDARLVSLLRPAIQHSKTEFSNLLRASLLQSPIGIHHLTLGLPGCSDWSSSKAATSEEVRRTPLVR